MISFIKFVSCHSVFPAAAHAGRIFIFFSFFEIGAEFLRFLTEFVWICVGVFFLGRRRVVFPTVYLTSLLLR